MSNIKIIPENKSIDDSKTKVLDKKDVIKSWIRWFFFAQSNYNYERLQATAFAHSMLPVIKKLYKNNEDKKAAVQDI